MVVLYVETLIGVTCSETSYRRVALIFRGSYMPVVREGGEKVTGGVEGEYVWRVVHARRSAVDGPGLTSYSTTVTNPRRARGCCEFVSPLI